MTEIIGLPKGALLQKSGEKTYVFFPVYFYDKAAKKGLRGKQKRRYIGTVVEGKFVPNKFFLDNPDCSRKHLRNEFKSVRNPWDQGFKHVDLSHTLAAGMPVFPGDPVPAFRTIKTVASDGYRMTEVCTVMHVGTHIDAPAHILEKGRAVNDYDLDSFLGSALVIDCTSYGEGSEIPANVLDPYEKQLGRAEFVLLRTDWDKHWGSDLYFRHPTPSQELCVALTQLNLKGVGFDTCGPDPVKNDRQIRHETLLSRNEIVLIENLRNLRAIPDHIFTLLCLPLSIQDAEASFTRAVAFYREDEL